MKAQVPTTSSAGNDVWYFIKGTRGATSTSLWVTAAVDNSQVLEKDLIGSDAQRWKVVVNGNGLALVNKAYGTYLNTDLPDYTDLNTVVSAPTTTLYIVPADSAHDLMVYAWVPGGVHVQNHGATNITWDAWADVSPASNTFLMHAGGSGDNFGLVNYYDDYSDNASFLFVAETSEIRFQALQALIAAATAATAPATGDNAVIVSAKASVQSAITAAQVVYNNSASTFSELGVASENLNAAFEKLKTLQALAAKIASVTLVYNSSAEGLNPGQFSADSRSVLQGMIATAQATLDNAASTSTDWMAAMADLTQVVDFFKTTVILPALSSSGSETWYYIQGTRPVNTYMTAPAGGAGTQVKDLPVIPNDTQLWRFVPNGDGFAMQNKASMEYLQTDFPTGTTLRTQVAVPMKP